MKIINSQPQIPANFDKAHSVFMSLVV